MLTFSSKGKAYSKRLGGKAREMKISSLPGESPSHSPPTLCLGSHLHPVPPRSIAFFCSSPFLRLHASPPFRLRLTYLVQGTTHASQVRMATPFSASSTCPASHGSLGRWTPFAPPFGEGPLPQPPQKLPPWRDWVILGRQARPSTRPTLPETEARETTAAFGEGPMPQPQQSFPHGGVGWFWQATDNVPHGGFGWF